MISEWLMISSSCSILGKTSAGLLQGGLSMLGRHQGGSWGTVGPQDRWGQVPRTPALQWKSTHMDVLRRVSDERLEDR